MQNSWRHPPRARRRAAPTLIGIFRPPGRVSAEPEEIGADRFRGLGFRVTAWIEPEDVELAGD